MRGSANGLVRDQAAPIADSQKPLRGRQVQVLDQGEEPEAPGDGLERYVRVIENAALLLAQWLQNNRRVGAALDVSVSERQLPEIE